MTAVKFTADKPAFSKYTISEDHSNLRKQSFSQTSFTSTPKIRRRHTGNRSVHETAKALVDSWYPETEVSYNAMKMRLMTQFDRCDRKTILAYLGRPKTRQKETIDHTVTYPKSGAVTNKVHTFIHKFPAKKGYLELFGLAALQTDFKTVLPNDFKTEKVMFKLFHTRQTILNEANSPLRIPPNDSFAIKVVW